MKPTFEEIFDRAARKAGFTVRPVNAMPARPARRHARKRADKAAGRNGRKR